ncbi:4Fe-4S dicluster domain-containing protein [Syntrophomonas erecta]
MAEKTRQWAKVVDLNKCLGCQECSVICKMWWTNREGAQHMWWSIVETRPGPGYPKDWEKRTARGQMPEADDYEKVPHFSYEKLQDNMGSKMPRLIPNPKQEWGPNWYDSIGEGNTPADNWFFHVHMACMHCSAPACVAACPSKAIYKRADGVVIINQELCKGFKACIQACPYKRIFWNDQLRVAEKCIMCYPLLEQGKAPICASSCVARAIFFGDISNPSSKVSKLVNEYKVALPIHKEYNTGANIYYIPPVLTAGIGGTDQMAQDQARIPEEYLVGLFGPEVKKIKNRLQNAVVMAREGKSSPLIDILVEYPNYEV